MTNNQFALLVVILILIIFFGGSFAGGVAVGVLIAMAYGMLPPDMIGAGRR